MVSIFDGADNKFAFVRLEVKAGDSFEAGKNKGKVTKGAKVRQDDAEIVGTGTA